MVANIHFNKKTEMVAMAHFTAQLIREGVTFSVDSTSSDEYFTVTLTGGF